MDARERARKLFKELSDSYSMSGHVSGRARDLVPEFEKALQEAFDAGKSDICPSCGVNQVRGVVAADF
jgi:hypothetical protein